MSASDVSPSRGWRLAEDFYRDARLEAAGIPHGVTTRQWDNMKDPERRRQALAAAGLGDRQLCLLKQVHGTEVLECNASQEAPEGDGWVCADLSFVPAVYVADCLPIFVWDYSGKAAVGVFHAGWRGLASGMPRAAVRAFRRYGLTPERLAASIGPHVGACCYRVGPEVARRFRPGVIKSHQGRRDILDLGEEARLQLAESGISPDLISVSENCTACTPDVFFSFRRDKMDCRPENSVRDSCPRGSLRGRMMAFISLWRGPHAH